MKKLLLIAALLGMGTIKGMEHNGKKYLKGTCNRSFMEDPLQPGDRYECKNYSRWEAQDPKSNEFVGSIKFTPEDCKINLLSVNSNYRGQKIGSTLFALTLESLSKSCKEVKWNSYRDAIKFYEKLGATRVDPNSHTLTIDPKLSNYISIDPNFKTALEKYKKERRVRRRNRSTKIFYKADKTEWL